MILVYKESDIVSVVNEFLLPVAQAGAIFLFDGALGAGKTTLIRALLQRLGVRGGICSPTFSYVYTHNVSDEMRVHHFDLYRVATKNDFLMVGFEEYLQDNAALVCIEWPGVIEPLLKQKQYMERVVSICLSHNAQAPDVRLFEME